jgi:formylmethanofuran dehydrogenase subunit E
MPADLHELLQASASRHRHLCPRQVLGVRMGLAGLGALGLEAPRQDKRLLVIVETDGCFTDGIEVTAGVAVGRRTLRVVDYGKVAATFADVQTGQSLRIAPRRDVRQRALDYAPDENRHYFAQLLGYQAMPVDELFSFQEVSLSPTIEELISQPGVRVNCSLCGEEVINARQVILAGQILCRSCAGDNYYALAGAPVDVGALAWLTHEI